MSIQVEVIRDYAFVASPYPVMLSIENHLSLPLQVLLSFYGPMSFTMLTSG
jgi:hypothetical protein